MTKELEILKKKDKKKHSIIAEDYESLKKINKNKSSNLNK